MSHPLTPDLSELSQEDLIKKMGDLNKKITFAMRSNYNLAQQMVMVLEDYQNELNKRNAEIQKEMMKDMGEDFFDDKINIG